MATRSYDLSKLRRALVEFFSEEELRILCFDLQVNYQSLPGSGQEDKARELVEYFKRRDTVQKLVESVKKERPQAVLEEAGERRRYHIASGKPGGSVAERLRINDIVGNSLELAEDFNQADIIIFDLDNPPPDWLKYFVEGQKPSANVVFVAFDADLQSRGPVELDGKNILDIIGRSYREDQILICKGREELSGALKYIAKSLKIPKDARRLAMREQ